MRLLSMLFLAQIAVACGTLPGVSRHQAAPCAPNVVEVDFDSSTATAQLMWTMAKGIDFLRYEVERDGGTGFAVVGTATAREDTQFVDGELWSNREYRYRVVAWFGDKKEERALSSPVVTGGIHRFVTSWRTGSANERFAPTRLVVDSHGTVSVAGVRNGRVARFEADGRPLEPLSYTEEPLACVAAGALDGPALALDSRDNLYVVYNVFREKAQPVPLWSKFTPGGELVWTRQLRGLFARHVAIDEEDNIFVETISQLQQFDSAGNRVEVRHVPAVLVASLQLWRGRFAALIEPLSLVDTDWQAPRLVVYQEPDRQHPGLVIGRDPASEQDRGSGLLRRPTDFSVAADGRRAFVVNAGLHRIEVFTDQRFLTRWGRQGAGSGEFAFSGQTRVVDDIAKGTVVERTVTAGGIACDVEGYVYVADTFNDRVQKFQP